MRKRVVAALMVACMSMGLAACGSAKEEKTDKTAEGKVDTSKHVTITYLTTGDAPKGEAKKNLDTMLSKLNEKLTKECNAELAISYTGWTDYLSVYNLTLAQMDGTVDLVGTASDWLDAWSNSKNGAFLALSEDMLKEYAPKTWASVSQDHWNLCKYNDEIFLMPEDNYAQWTNHGFAYRTDWAKAAGLTDGKVSSWDTMTTYVDYVTKNADDLGLKVAWDSDGTSMIGLASGWISSHSDFVPVDGISAGGIWGGSRDNLYTLQTPAYTNTEMMVEFAKTMKQWDEMGVWPTDVLNNTNSDNRTEFRQGTTALEQHHSSTWTDLCSVQNPDNKALNKDKNAGVGFFYFGEETKNVIGQNITHGAMAVSAGSKNPERALMVYDLLRNDEECYDLINYGIKGVSYDVDKEGLRTTPKDYDAETQNINGMTNFWWGRNDDLEIKSAQRDWDKIDALYAEYEGEKIEYPYGQFVPDMDNIQSMINNIEAVYEQYMKVIAYGKYKGSAEDYVKEMQEALKGAGIETVTAELQSQMDEMYKK